MTACPDCKGTGLYRFQDPLDPKGINVVPCYQCLGTGDARPPLPITLREAMELAEYSATYPTGATLGKRWRRHDGSHDREFTRRGGRPTWLICEYYEGPRTGKGSVSIRTYRPVIRIKAISVPL